MVMKCSPGAPSGRSSSDSADGQVDAGGADERRVVGDLVQPVGDERGQRRTRQVREPLDLADPRHRHDPRDDRQVAAQGAHARHEVEVAVER